MDVADRLSAVRADAPFRNALEALAPALEASRDCLATDASLLAGGGLTEAMILRLRAFYRAQAAIKDILGKQYMTAGADFFAETVLFYLRAVLKKTVPNVKVEGERTVAPRRGAMRPDISLWIDSVLVAFVECKTQLGWNRLGWR